MARGQHEEHNPNRKVDRNSIYRRENGDDAPSEREWKKMRNEMGGSSTSRKQDIEDYNEGLY